MLGAALLSVEFKNCRLLECLLGVYHPPVPTHRDDTDCRLLIRETKANSQVRTEVGMRSFFLGVV